MRNFTTDKFIENAIKIHKNIYDYSETNYINNKTHTIIICKLHGKFTQRPDNHLNGQGCPQCGIKKGAIKRKCNTSDFIEKAKKIHGDKYDYSNVKYINVYTHIAIICNEHGKFYQLPHDHLLGKGCKLCGRISTANSRKLNTYDFIKKSIKVHGNKYDYSKVKYINNRTKVIIICPKHGEFTQTANNHLMGNRCPKCYKPDMYTVNTFIDKSIEIHGNKYDYTLVKYKNLYTKVEILCKTHGKFLQSPSQHLKGRGCYKCGLAYNSKKETEFLNYLNIPENDRQYKIGVYVVDGVIVENKIIYEFLGNYWHGNLNIFPADKINKHLNKTFGQLNRETFDRFEILKEYGYTIKYIWESDWNDFKKNKLKLNIKIY